MQSYRQPVGYLINRKTYLEGRKGTMFDYIVAENGIFIQSHNDFMAARIYVAPAKIKGLDRLESRFFFKHGRIPPALYDLALSILHAHPYQEVYMAIVWKDGGYHLSYPEQLKGKEFVLYEAQEDLVMDIHGHGNLDIQHSLKDNSDEQGFKLSMVAIKLDAVPEYYTRLCIYGYYANIKIEEVFDLHPQQ